MADRFFEEVLEKRLVWLDPRFKRSAFKGYTDRPMVEARSLDLRLGNFGGAGNMSKRMIELLKSNWAAVEAAREPERQRGYRHMISERMRREKQKQSYLALHSFLPQGTKNDKNSVIQAAAVELQRLQSSEKELRRRNFELESKSVLQEQGAGDEEVGVVKISLRLANLESDGTDAMLETLRCLKNLGVKIKAIHSGFSGPEFSVIVEAESEMSEAANVEETVRRSLQEADGKLLSPFHEG